MNDDVDIETDPEYDEENIRDALKKTKEKLKEIEKQKQEYLLGWQRAKADYINSKKKEEEDAKELVKFANANLIAELIPVLDSFEMAFSNKESWEKVSSDWRKGVEYIYSQLLSVMTANGIAQLNPLNEEFNPNVHDAVDVIETDDLKKDGKILEVIQKGYTLNGKVIRTAKVKIGKLKDNS